MKTSITKSALEKLATCSGGRKIIVTIMPSAASALRDGYGEPDDVLVLDYRGKPRSIGFELRIRGRGEY